MTTQETNKDRPTRTESTAPDTVEGSTWVQKGQSPSTQPDASKLVDKAQDQAKDVMESAEKQAKSTLAQGKSRAAEQVSTVAQALRASSDELRNQHADSIAKYTEQAADRIDRLATTLRERDVDQMRRDVEGFAREKPEVFMGGAFVAGLLLARFLKSSSERQYQQEAQSRYEPRYASGRAYGTSEYETRYERPSTRTTER